MAQSGKRRRLSQDGKYESSATNGIHVEEADVESSSNKKADQRRSLFVRSLPASVTTEQLTEIFSQSYPLKHATVVLDTRTKISRGFGFVTFADPEDAQAAATEFNDSILDGRKIKVELAESRHREIAEDGGKSVPSTKTTELKAEREKKKAEALPPKLIVRNLPWSIKEPEDLALLFRSYGKVKLAVVPKRNPKVQAGFGFVVLRGRKNAERALEGVNGKVVDGRTLAVDWAVDKETWEKVQDAGQQESVDTQAANISTAVSAPNATNTEDNVSTNDEAPEDGSDSTEVDALIGNDAEHEEASEDQVGLSQDDEDEPTDDDDEQPTQNNTTIFVRNLPFTTTDSDLHTHFSRFGAIRYARVVSDPETERPKGTAFVCFFNEDDAKNCVKQAPKHQPPTSTFTPDKKRRGETRLKHSILQNEATDQTGRYTLEGRVLQVSRALSKADASRREAEGSSKRELRDRDRRRLYLLSEGTIPKDSKLYQSLGPTEINIREASAKQRQKLIRSNPSLHMSLTRLSVRNIPRSVTSKDLKALAREAVVGFATDVKSGLREPLSREELSRGLEEMKAAEKLRKQQGTGIVKQAKIVFEGREGSKVPEKSGAGRSRGYGFVEYVSHRNALMGLRWLNGRVVSGSAKDDGGEGGKKKRLIVEFAIENAQVVHRRAELEGKARKERKAPRSRRPEKGELDRTRDGNHGAQNSIKGKKRKRNEKDVEFETPTSASKKPATADEKNKVPKRNRIISRKRMQRKARK